MSCLTSVVCSPSACGPQSTEQNLSARLWLLFPTVNYLWQFYILYLHSASVFFNACWDMQPWKAGGAALSHWKLVYSLLSLKHSRVFRGFNFNSNQVVTKQTDSAPHQICLTIMCYTSTVSSLCWPALHLRCHSELCFALKICWSLRCPSCDPGEKWRIHVSHCICTS